MDVCGHNESDVELNLRTLREKQRIEIFFLSSCSVFSKICMKKFFLFFFKKSQRENLKTHSPPKRVIVHIINYIYYK